VKSINYEGRHSAKFSHRPVTSSLFDQYILLRALWKLILNICYEDIFRLNVVTVMIFYRN